jgi:hypothetical protein
LALSPPSYADTLRFKADLKGSNEVPPNASPGTGSLTVTYDTTSKVLSWEGSYSGMTGPATAAHFHGPAEPGKNAGVAVPIAGTHGTAKLTDAQAAELMAGRWYVNIHTQAVVVTVTNTEEECHSLIVLTTLDSDRALLLVEYLSCDRTISSYFTSVVTGSFGTMCTIL